MATKRNSLLVLLYRIWISFTVYFRFKPFAFVVNFFSFIKDYNRLKRDTSNPNFQFYLTDFTPCLADKTSMTPLDPVYFYQDSWGASKIFDLKPAKHFDVGSSAKTIGIISQFVPTTMVDIRPIELPLPNLSFIQGSILDLPLENNSVESISSLCVIEHIGLGRYGDPIDSYGSEKAIKEIVRVTRQGGSILFSVPVDEFSRIYFNAHRAFTRAYILLLFKDCILKEEKYIYGKKMVENYLPEAGYGIGLYHFIKQ